LARRLSAIALRECDHLNNIISDFLDYARAPKEPQDLVDPWKAVLDAAAVLRQHCTPGEESRICLGAAPAACAVRGNSTQLRQVFENIGKNALDAMGEGGVLEIAAMREAKSISIIFNDAGPGIPPDEVARIFEPFYTTKDTGIGMGLAVCLRIITAHNGTIHVAARRQGGTSVAVRLPLAQTEGG
jgi:signal transduction histidine kinase